MSKVDISSEAVERLVQAVAVDAVAVSATTIVTLRAQAERIKELEERCRIVSRGLGALIEGATND